MTKCSSSMENTLRTQANTSDVRVAELDKQTHSGMDSVVQFGCRSVRALSLLFDQKICPFIHQENMSVKCIPP